MKKVILLLSTVAILGFASCTKSLDSEVNDLEIVFEELEGTETKAALTEIKLDKFGDFEPSSQLLTARLQYAKTKEKVSGQVEYVWDVKCNAVDENPDGYNSARNTLVAQSAGTGTVSVSATYKGQEVQSSNVPIKVTANALTSLLIDLHSHNEINEKPAVPFWDNHGLPGDVSPFKDVNGIPYVCDYDDLYALQFGLYEVYSNNTKKRVSLWSYPSTPGSYAPDTNFQVNTDVAISFPDISSGFFKISPYRGNGGFPLEGYWTYCYFTGTYKSDSALAGPHKIRVNYKGMSAEETFEIFKLEWK